MSLQVWLPLNGSLVNQGLSDADIIANGATVNANGKIGKCYSFDGSDDLISINCSNLYKTFSGGTQQFSIAFWVYHADATRAIIFGDYGLTGTIQFNIELTTGHQIRFYWAANPDKNFAATTAIAVSTWTHIVLTYDGNKINLYKNGILQSDSWSGTLATKSKTTGLFYLGRDSRTGNTVLNGRLNDFRIYDHALSVKEVEEISKGLMLHYKMDIEKHQNNLLLDTLKDQNKTHTTYGIADFNFSESLIEGKKYTVTAKINTSPERLWVGFFHSGGTNSMRPDGQSLAWFPISEDGCYQVTFTATAAMAAFTTGIGYGFCRVYISSNPAGSQGSMTISGTANVDWIKIEKGTVATPWTANVADTGAFEEYNKIYDCSGYRHDALMTGAITPAFPSSRYRTAVHTVSGSYIRTEGRPIDILPTDAITVNIWINPSTWGQNPISCTEGGGWNFEQINTTDGIQFPVYAGGYKTAKSGVAASSILNGWHMLTGTFDKAYTKIYIDGELKASTSTGATNPITYPNNYVFIGGEAGGNSSTPAASTFVGDISDVRIYCTALTEAQVKELYNTSATVDNNGNLYVREVIET